MASRRRRDPSRMPLPGDVLSRRRGEGPARLEVTAVGDVNVTSRLGRQGETTRSRAAYARLASDFDLLYADPRVAWAHEEGRRAAGRELSALARELGDLGDRMGASLVAMALSDVGSRLEAGLPVEDGGLPGVIEATCAPAGEEGEGGR